MLGGTIADGFEIHCYARPGPDEALCECGSVKDEHALAGSDLRGARPKRGVAGNRIAMTHQNSNQKQNSRKGDQEADCYACQYRVAPAFTPQSLHWSNRSRYDGFAVQEIVEVIGQLTRG